MNDAEFQRIAADPQARIANCQRMVVAYFDRVTDTYRRAWGDSFHFALFSGTETLPEAMVATERMLADEGGFRPGMRVLDIGCGVGGPALNIAEHSGAHVTGVNIVPHQVEIARRRAAERGLSERTHFEVADAMSMPFPMARSTPRTASTRAATCPTRRASTSSAPACCAPAGCSSATTGCSATD
jgi:ubiquinone/menaquinone biosynthesis C-methylase UbiE